MPNYPCPDHYNRGAPAFERYSRRGTVAGLRESLRLLAGVAAIIQEPILDAAWWSLPSEIDPCACRRIVISFGGYALRCHTDKPDLSVIVPKVVKAGEPKKRFVLRGLHFKDNMRVYLGKGVKVDYVDGKVKPDAGVDTYPNID